MMVPFATINSDRRRIMWRRWSAGRVRIMQRRCRDQGGFTILEAMLALTISTIVAGVTLSAFIVTMRSNRSVSASLESSDSAFFASTQFANDISSVAPVSGAPDPVAAGEPGCGGGESILRLVGPASDGDGSAGSAERSRLATADLEARDGGPASDAAADQVRVLSYHLDSNGDRRALRRYVCTGSDLRDALRADRSYMGTIVSDVGSGSDAVAVSCDGAEIVGPCHRVTLRVKTVTDRVISVQGTIRSVLAPTPTTAPAPVVAPPSGTCTIDASETTWGGTGGAAGSGDGHARDENLYTYNDTNQRNSYLKFDLTQPCSGDGDTWPKLPGGRNLTAVTLNLAYTGKTGSSCWIFPGVSRDEQVLQPLNDSSQWSEATLRGSNMPTGVIGGYDYKFKVANAGSVTSHTGTGIVESVKQWYAAGGWANNGWILRRDGVGDTCGNSNKFASRFAGDDSIRPTLVITWGP